MIRAREISLLLSDRVPRPATSNGLAAPVANPGATTSQGGLFAAVAAKNAELLAVKEGEHRRIKANCRGAIIVLRTGKRLIKDVKKLPAAPFSMMVEKGPTLAKLLEREGCIGWHVEVE